MLNISLPPSVRRAVTGCAFLLLTASTAVAQQVDRGGQRIQGDVDPMRSLLWVLIILLIPAGLFALALFQPWNYFLRRQQKKRVKQAARPRPAEPARERRLYFDQKPPGEHDQG